MLRVTQLIRDSLSGAPIKEFDGAIAIWNLTNMCNLRCEHCYSSAVLNRDGELSSKQIFEIIPQLKQANVRVAVLSGGEPLIREDIFEIAACLRENGIIPDLSTNGTMITDQNAARIKEHFPYIGISIDGDATTHDKFRDSKGSHSKSLASLLLLRDIGAHVGLRFTISKNTVESLPYIFDLCEEENFSRLYLSHLVYSGRGGQCEDLQQDDYRDVVESILDKAFEYVISDSQQEIVTGNNEADAVALYRRFSKLHPEHADDMWERLRTWGGNQAGSRMFNIDYRGNVKPDPFHDCILGNVTESPLAEIWNHHPGFRWLKQAPRELLGRCSECKYLEICNGSSRARAKAVYNDYRAEDPACYIRDI